MVYNRYLENDSKFNIVLDFIKKIFSFKNILFSVLSFTLANVTVMGEYTPFSYVMFGVASVFNMPLLLVLLFSFLGMLCTNITAGMVIRLLVFFALFTFITAILNIKGTSKKYSVFFKFLLSSAIVEFVFNFINNTLFTDFAKILSNLLLISSLYFVFVFGMHALMNINKNYAYTKEESIAMIAIIVIAATIFKDIEVFGFSVFNVVLLVIMLMYGWKKGPIYGGAAGIIIGLLLTTLMDVSMTYIVSIAFSSCIAGVFSKFGKLSVLAAFLAGNIYIIYYANEFSMLTIRISELLIASIPLLFMPKALEEKLSKLFDKNKTLDKTYENMLDTASDVKRKVGAVSEVFENLSNTYVELSEENKKENREVIKKYISDYITENCIDCKAKKKCLSEEKLEKVADDVCKKLENNEYIDESNLDFDCMKTEQLLEAIKDIYGSMKLARVLKEKEKESSRKISKQYKEVSKVLANIANNIKKADITLNKKQKKLADELKFYGYTVYEDSFEETNENIEYTFVTDILTDIDKQKKEILTIATDILEQDMVIKLILNSSKKEKSRVKLVSTPAFEVQNAAVSFVKNGEDVSGDNYLSYELNDLKHMSILSDGAGSGVQAAHSSKTLITMLEKLLEGGFTEEKSIEIINSVIKLNLDETVYSTLDSVAIDLKTADATFVKLGCAPTYILTDGKIVTINSVSIPVGILEETSYMPIHKMLKDSDIVIQVSDGIIGEEIDINNNYFTSFLTTLDVTKSAKNLADDISKFLLKENSNTFSDDITVLLTKVRKNKLKK